MSEQYQGQTSDSELGKKSEYDDTYNPDRLYPIARSGKRSEIGIDPNRLPFYGFDCWNHYEVSWLNDKGKPVVAIAEILYNCSSPFLIESKSLKLYFNSLNNTKFKHKREVEVMIKDDLEQRVQSDVAVTIHELGQYSGWSMSEAFQGVCLDALDIECSTYQVDPSLLSASGDSVEEVLYSDLLKSNCLVTGQPDWGSVQIAYRGQQIHREGLLQYIVSFRNHNEFHEQCIERIFVDVMKRCHPEELTVYGRYTRRGGLDINPLRSSRPVSWPNRNIRLLRQ
ncbi:NADPH-dependent 7-cyano-7-deazaguanine reductase QueF [Legionella spiritensis]|uniref:NADPH-dependent 7-cyano-7-deazaguanine reductase n=1 Tax=Legionella spiritensis TaxID=452 RepID=A0A0W0Z817_LEGSP|nr:NADPH-dependent 7-cyano-7-deazaguanine reductase QueF [Legionella spiritensis]KTD65266.1 GTP cyclohydrolase [Legionella spiritensis]SNV30208.1 GTP cyclohydrolase [Legionella spiritensis]